MGNRHRHTEPNTRQISGNIVENGEEGLKEIEGDNGTTKNVLKRKKEKGKMWCLAHNSFN